MTLVVCLEGTNGLILAADSRGTIGDPRGLTAVNDTHIKLFKLSNKVGILSFGQAELANQLITEVRNQLLNTDIYFTQVFNAARNKMIRSYNDWFKQFPIDKRPLLGFVIGGIEENNDKKVYYLTSSLDFAPQQCTSGFALGGVPQYATYLLHKFYNRTMERNQLASLAVYVVSETASQDPKVGGPIRMAEIPIDNNYRDFTNEQINTIIARNNVQNENLRQFFIEGRANGR